MITDIRLQQFRSYSDDSFEFSPGVNIVVGPNASGKTNLLEAVLVTARGTSYRVKDVELIAYGKPWARLEAHTGEDARQVTIERTGERVQKQFKFNDQILRCLQLSRTIPVVLFEPNHLQLLTGSPELRRNFLDDMLEQIQPGFATLRQQYRRVLSQRNALLKTTHRVPADQMFVWNVRLSEFGEQIARARHSLVQNMNKQITEVYQAISHSPATITLAYQSVVDSEQYATNLLHKLEANHHADVARGFTAHGPHREDVVVELGSHPAPETASRGETRTILLALKMIEALLLEQARDTRPLLLFDDVFSELDNKRRQSLTNFLHSYQTFITTTDADVVIQHFTESAHIIPLPIT